MKYIKNKVIILFIILCSGLVVKPCNGQFYNEENPELLVLQNQHPSAIFFRNSTEMKNLIYGEWESIFSRLGGFIGKAMNEEKPNMEVAIPKCHSFKQGHPDQIVLLHYNGEARNPNDSSWNLHPSHFLYYEGCELLEDIALQNGLYEIKVEKPGIFITKTGNNDKVNEDIGICRKTVDGKPDWDYSEQVKLISVDNENKTITVERAQFGSEARKFTAGQTLLCPHLSWGPWGVNNQLSWYYNYSTVCPEDGNGKTCSDFMTDYFAGLFGKGGKLELFDGVEFDVLYNEIRIQTNGRLADADCDGKGDGGIINGVDVYSIGIYNFLKQLREKLGPDKIIMADCNKSNNQRGVPFLNGMESEGWPSHQDTDIKDWSGGWNRQLFYNQNSFEPRFSFVNFKYTRNYPPPLTRQRLVWAIAPLMDAAISGVYPERASRGNPDSDYTIIDEIVGGQKQERFWLGEALTDAVRLAYKSPDVLDGKGVALSDEFLLRLKGEGVGFTKVGDQLLIERDSPDQPIKFSIEDIPCNGPDLVVTMEIKGEYRAAYPEGMPRAMYVHSSEDNYELMTFLNDKWFRAAFYFRDIRSNYLTIFAEIESDENVYIRNLTAHAHPDAVYREFENGMVLVNPAHHSYTFNLNNIAPGKQFRRLKATDGQDIQTNNGETVGESVILEERSGLFLMTHAGVPNAVKENDLDQLVKIYPNPVQDTQKLAIRINDHDLSIENVSIYNYTGRNVTNISEFGDNTNYAEFGFNGKYGLYLVKINTNKGIVVKKIINKSNI